MNGSRLPIFLLTGFLGSGKTTLLAHWLTLPNFGDTAVVINEAGAVQVDGALVGRANENVRVLEGGCVCCEVLDDLGAAIEALLNARDANAVPPFSRLLVETSGLADPGPIGASLICDRRLSTRVRHEGTIAILDGVNGARNLERYPEARSQLAHAEHVIMTKADLLDEGARAETESAIRRINMHASRAWSSRIDPADPPLHDPVRQGPSLLRPVRAPAGRALGVAAPGTHGLAPSHEHSSLRAHAFRFSGPIDGASLIEAIDLAEQLFAGKIIRSKSVFVDTYSGAGYAVHTVHGVMDQPVEIDDVDATSTGIVIFTHCLSRERLAQVLSPFVPLSDGPEAAREKRATGH